MDRAGEMRRLAERLAAAGGKRIIITPASAQIASYALRAWADMISRPTGDHPTFTVDVWDARGALIETIASSSNFLVARAAYDATIVERPRYEVTLRNMARVIAVHAPAPPT